MTDAENILADMVDARLAVIADVDRFDGGIPRTPQRPYLIMSGGIRTASEQRYSDTHERVYWTYAVVVVNNSPAGTRLLAGRVLDLLDDGTRQGVAPDGLYSALDSTSDLITDDSIEGDWRHSITLHMQART